MRLAQKASFDLRRGFSASQPAMEDILFILPFDKPVKHFGMVGDHVAQLGVTCVRTKPAAVSPTVTVDR